MRRGAFLVSAMVLATAGIVSDGVLTDWHPEEEFLFEYNRRPRDAVTIRVREVRKLVEPVAINDELRPDGTVARFSLQNGAA
eukprot:6234138-Lingulodinium_polyedra.AAC.1